LIKSGFKDLDDDERRSWEADFDADRRRWRQHLER